MNGGVFGGYDKPSFQPKNLTSDNWQMISATNNYSAYTPDKPAQQETPSPRTRQSAAKTSSYVPAEKAPQRRGAASGDKNRGAAQPKKAAPKAKKSPPKQNSSPTKKAKEKVQDRPISSGRVPDGSKPKKTKAPSIRQRNSAEKRRQKTNLAFIRLRNKGKTADEARIIITRRKIRLKRIKTFSSVALFFLFALSFLSSYSYFQGAEISEILIEGNDIYTDVEVLEAAKLETGMNMLTVREKQVNDNVTTVLPFISQIGVDYKLPDTLALNIVSTKERLILKCGRKYICVDEFGKVVSDKKKKLTEGTFLVQGLAEQEYTVGEAFSVSEENAERYRIAGEFAGIAANAETLNYGVLDLKDLKDISFIYRSKICIYLGDGKNLQEKLESAIAVMKESDIGDKTGYIDLKFDTAAYFMDGTMG